MCCSCLLLLFVLLCFVHRDREQESSVRHHRQVHTGVTQVTHSSLDGHAHTSTHTYIHIYTYIERVASVVCVYIHIEYMWANGSGSSECCFRLHCFCFRFFWLCFWLYFGFALAQLLALLLALLWFYFGFAFGSDFGFTLALLLLCFWLLILI